MPERHQRKIRRRDFLKLLGAGAAVSFWAGPAFSVESKRQSSGTKQNVIVILTDDIGYGDLGCYGNPYTRTPNLDKFASEGVKFTNCYAASPNCSPANLRGAKGHLHEGGIRVPGMFQWPGHTKSGVVIDEPVNGTDVLPTVCAVTGAKMPTDRVIDGGNFLPVLEGKSIKRACPLFWGMWFGRGGYSYALREGRWKILAGTGPVPAGIKIIDFIREPKFIRWQLVNLRQDPAETRDFWKDEPERFEKMKEKLIALHKEIVAEGPYWSLEEHRGKNQYLWMDKPSYPYTDKPFVGHREPGI